MTLNEQSVSPILICLFQKWSEFRLLFAIFHIQVKWNESLFLRNDCFSFEVMCFLCRWAYSLLKSYFLLFNGVYCILAFNLLIMKKVYPYGWGIWDFKEKGSKTHFRLWLKRQFDYSVYNIWAWFPGKPERRALTILNIIRGH